MTLLPSTCTLILLHTFIIYPHADRGFSLTFVPSVLAYNGAGGGESDAPNNVTYSTISHILWQKSPPREFQHCPRQTQISKVRRGISKTV